MKIKEEYLILNSNLEDILDILFIDDTISIAYDARKASLFIEFGCYDVCREAYQNALEEVFSIILLKNIQKIVFNQSKKSFFRKEDALWAWTHWIPRLAGHWGRKGKLAIILPISMTFGLEQRTLHFIPFKNKVFTSCVEAEKWLEQ